MIISVSFTNFKNSQKETIELINQSKADYLHIDLFDGKFVPTKQQQPVELNKLLSSIKKPLDVHLMAEKPLSYLEYFANLNTDYFVFHYEVVKDILEAISRVKETGIKVGIAIHLSTEVENLKPYLHLLDQVLIMSAEGGYGGASFNPIALEKISELKALKEENGYHYLINVDCGINAETINLVREAGADMVVSGSYICMSDDIQGAIDSLR